MNCIFLLLLFLGFHEGRGFDDDEEKEGDDDDPRTDADYEAGVLNELLLELNRYRNNVASLSFMGGDAVTNPLQWWKDHAPSFPHVAVLARRYLCIPATSAPSERLFSTAGLTITKARNGLRDDNASAIIFLHKTWPAVDMYFADRNINN